MSSKSHKQVKNWNKW